MKFYKFIDYLHRRFFIDFRYDEDFLLSELHEPIIFSTEQYENETALQRQIRIIKLILLTKSGAKVRAQFSPFHDYPELLKWYRDKRQISYLDFCGNSNIVENIKDSTIRLLLKTEPKKIKYEDLDLSVSL